MTALRRISPEELGSAHRDALDAGIVEAAAAIVDEVRRDGESALRRHAARLGDIEAADATIVRTRDDLEAAYASLALSDRELLQRTAARIQTFAEAQLDCLLPLDTPIPGGRAGHEFAPVDRAGCYAPGGRYPLPSSVLMTAVTARVAGVREVWVASPRPAPVTMAAAWVAGADAMLTVGGAQAVAALAWGAGAVPRADVIVGPGNAWVTAAKQLVSGHVGIDMLAGPSELVVLADDSADAEIVAADLLAQAEHDDDARPILITTCAALADRVDQAISRQLTTLPTASTATAAISGAGFTVICSGLDEAVRACDRLAPEHLQILTREPEALRRRLRHYGAIFVGTRSGEVLGDYGAGPNHVLPTGGTARFRGGLSVTHFLRLRTWLQLEDSDETTALASDAAALARLEGLEGHARAAERRGDS